MIALKKMNNVKIFLLKSSKISTMSLTRYEINVLYKNCLYNK